jgi:hypothetical protein
MPPGKSPDVSPAAKLAAPARGSSRIAAQGGRSHAIPANNIAIGDNLAIRLASNQPESPVEFQGGALTVIDTVALAVPPFPSEMV